MARPTMIEDSVCLGCGCLCDDIRVDHSDEGVIDAARACSLGRQWFGELRQTLREECYLDGQPATRDQGLERAVEILRSAQGPLVCGLKGAATDAQRLAVGLADRLGGCVDWTTSKADAASVLAFQTNGAVAASLGEIARRADLIVFWQCDPTETHPRHAERYSIEPSSAWLPQGQQDRTLVVVGEADSAIADAAGLVIPLQPYESCECLQLLRGFLEGKDLAEAQRSLPVEPLKRLAENIHQSRLTAVFYGAAFKQEGVAALAELTLLAQRVQPNTRLAVCGLGAADNATGAENVMAWQTGYPMSVCFARGFPEYGPEEFSTEAQLVSQEADAALVVSSAGLSGLSERARDRLRQLPTVVLSESPTPDLSADVDFPVALLGAKPGGSVYRCDGLTLPLENEFASAPSHAEVLGDLENRFQE